MSHYISITEAERAEMLAAIGVERVADLFADVPEAVRFPELKLPPALSEMELRRELGAMANRNANAAGNSIFLGAGAYNHFVPSAVDQILRRGEFFTAYTPYQPEISQGTLQAIFEYQSMICALTGMEVANASHYDGATALAEAVIMALQPRRGKRRKVVRQPERAPAVPRGRPHLHAGHGRCALIGDETPARRPATTLAGAARRRHGLRGGAEPRISSARSTTSAAIAEHGARRRRAASSSRCRPDQPGPLHSRPASTAPTS